MVRVEEQDGFFLEVGFGQRLRRVELQARLGDVVDPVLGLVADGDLPFHVQILRGGDGGLRPDVGARGVEGGEAAAAAVADVVADVGLEGRAFGAFDGLGLVGDAAAV